MQPEKSIEAELEATARCYLAQLRGTHPGAVDAVDVTTIMAVLEATIEANDLWLVMPQRSAMCAWGRTVLRALERRKILVRGERAAGGLEAMARWWTTTGRGDAEHWRMTCLWGEFVRAVASALLAMPRSVAELEKRLAPVWVWTPEASTPAAWKQDVYDNAIAALQAVWRQEGASE